MSSVQEEKLAVLQDQVTKLQGQKDSLLRELDGVEERFERTSRLYRKYFPVIIDSIVAGDNSFSKVCRDLSAALKKEESDGKIEYIFEQLKTAMLKEDIGPSPVKKKKGLLSALMKNDSGSFIDEYKQSYHDVVNNLRSTLDKKYSGKLDNLTARIKTVQDTDDISDIRESVFSLVFIYISDTNQDRDKVNAFVREVVGKILDIESKVAHTYQHTDSIIQSNEGFESVLTGQMQDLKHSSDVASSLESLKKQVSERLASIEHALKQKQAKDAAIKDLAKKNRHSFLKGFEKLKDELDEATKYTEELEKKLNQDQLTGAFNRRAYDNKMEEEMARFLRYDSGFSILLIDADNFKRINDNYGHAIGDKCLQEIIKRSIPLLRKNDMLARYGGEEFVVIMPETDTAGAREVAEKIRQTIEKIEFIYKNEKVKVTVSIGVSGTQKGDTTHQQIFERADIAVYKAKEQGRNRVLVN
ncbi:MAG: GGDEF domain-containing protein [Proteobacteria bacterium]|nr:GGDEF domain-containing protein [Pseudomonadota bacterium]MBU1387003.1 GGDEF domain-containing protein [Pseudomonadota bacterium]MBU1542316.1 GGDEF domain-containing protein [Pseudomonadota bacterium]MBU2430792.1 GGDEF domain-containing protein [Pseudomonadota bacterium]MBU2481779.1 GGDEF domain-containing protein [Pseudomonadota bacterium]